MAEASVNRVLADLIGKRVVVRSATGESEYSDEGVLVDAETPWIRVRTDNNDILCFPLYRVRLVKLIGEW